MEETNAPLNCPGCGSERTVKDGSYRGTPRRLCRTCNRRYSGRTKGATPETKRFAVRMYIEGLGFSAIGRLLKRSPTCILYWVREAAENLSVGRTVSDIPESVPVIEFDEMWHFVKKNPQNFGYGLLMTQSGENRSLLFAGKETKKPVAKSLTG